MHEKRKESADRQEVTVGGNLEAKNYTKRVGNES